MLLRPVLAAVHCRPCLSRLCRAGSFQTEAVAVQAETIVDGLEHPWGLDFLPDGDTIVTERPGRIRILSRDGACPILSKVFPTSLRAARAGLLDIAASPDFEFSNLVFFSFSQPGVGGAGTAVARARLMRDGDKARLEDMQVIFTMAKKDRHTRHFGSRLVFSPDGTLFVTTGDRGDGKRAQDMADHAGAVIRINPDGSIPADNPSPDGSKHLPEIWSKGHRNMQGAVFDPLLGALITVEHGAMGGDELNRPEAGKNYGWPVISYGINYSGKKIGVGTEAAGLRAADLLLGPVDRPFRTGQLQGDMFPEWNGDLSTGSLKFELRVAPRPRRNRQDRRRGADVRGRIRQDTRRQRSARRLDLASDRRK